MQTVTLRAIEPDDIDAIFRWENDPAVWNVSAAHQPFSRHALQRFIDQCDGSDIYSSRQLRLMAVDADARTVGCIDLYDFDPFHRRAAVGIIVDSAMRHKGYATAMLLALSGFAHRHLNLHQLYCDIAADNLFSLRLFHNAGFQECGTMRQWIWDGTRWIDAHRLQALLPLSDSN